MSEQPIHPAPDQLPDYLTDTAPGVWEPDIMRGFQRLSLPLGYDDQGPVSATLVRRAPADVDWSLPVPGRNCSAEPDTIPVLSVHGWSDYFFNADEAEAFEQAGYRFYALDLRKYGRSLRRYQTPGFIDSLSNYDDEIRAGLAVLDRLHPGQQPVLLGHSTGALTLSLWAQRHPGRIRALIMNSPWLELQGNSWVRGMAQAVVEPLSKISPNSMVNLPHTDSYWQSLSAQAHGEWNLHPLWRPRYSFRVPRTWLIAVLTGHRLVASGLEIREPILVLTSRATKFTMKYQPEVQRADAVIDVKVTADRAAHLGRTMTLVKITDALHDVFASAPEVRREALTVATTWLEWALGWPDV
ncbi:alpha/beta hydrolase [Auritidibacter sp. NML120779]|nr:alpha/beta hydrolase [Auritidibacter sp. NML120779]